MLNPDLERDARSRKSELAESVDRVSLNRLNRNKWFVSRGFCCSPHDRFLMKKRGFRGGLPD